MKHILRSLALSSLLALLPGCAGGWRNGAPPEAPGAAVAAPATPVAAGNTATADGAVFVWKGGGNTVNVAGEFNSWSTSADPMQKQADGSFTLAKKLAAGRYMYKFVVDGSNWKEDPNAKETADDGYGGKNAVMVVGGAAAAPAAQAAPAATKALAPGAGARAPQLTAKGVVFTFAGAARTGVALCGDFNNWAASADPLVQQADGTWTITRKIPAGSYGYKFLVDGITWKQDEGNPDSKDDGFGGKNSVVTVK
jgi:1,4-alpha-glucan branching enzyme